MILLSNEDLSGLVPPTELIGAVEAAVQGAARGEISVPKRLHEEWGSNTFLAMPAVAEKVFGTKLVSVVPGNAARGLPVTNGLMVLNDGETGLPLALMNAALLTAQRTGAVGALGVKYMTPSDTDSLGIIGCGVQGAWQAIFACALRPIRSIYCVDPVAHGVEVFSATVQRHVPGVQITPCRDACELLERTHLVICATTSSTPVVPDEPARLEHKHFISIGSFRPSMQELPNAVYRLARELVIDSEHARHEVGDVMNALKLGILRDEDVYSIAECVAGRRTIDVIRTTAYKTVGMAAYDLFAARAFYEAAKQRRVGQEIDL